MLSALAYEDVHPHEWKGYYAVPNEGTSEWADLLKGKSLWRAAGICSSGETGFFGILPYVRRELVLIDHSYKSIQVAALKYLLLKEKGALEVQRLCTQKDITELQQAVAAVKNSLPDKLRTCFKSNEGGMWLQPKILTNPSDRYSYNHDRYSFGSADDDADYDFLKLRQEWSKIPPKLVQRAVNRLDRVRFIHGDLTDLVKDGPFNLLYLSNALSHPNREGGASVYSYSAPPNTLKTIEACLTEGGYVIVADASYDSLNKQYTSRGWTYLDHRKSGAWSQSLYQVKAA